MALTFNSSGKPVKKKEEPAKVEPDSSLQPIAKMFPLAGMLGDYVSPHANTVTLPDGVTFNVPIDFNPGTAQVTIVKSKNGEKTGKIKVNLSGPKFTEEEIAKQAEFKTLYAIKTQPNWHQLYETGDEKEKEETPPWQDDTQVAKKFHKDWLKAGHQMGKTGMQEEFVDQYMNTPKPVPGGAVDVLEGMAQLDEAKISEEQNQTLVTTEEANTEVLSLVDEYTALEAQIKAADVSHLIKEQEAIKKKLQSIAKASYYPAHKPVQLYGTHKNYVEFSAQSNKTEIADKDGLIAKIGVDKYIENTAITLTAANKLLTENELAKYTTTVPGARTMKGVYTGE